ncbi:unnamed protein product, partial [Ectocarpus sp. 4 AP-2014]
MIHELFITGVLCSRLKTSINPLKPRSIFSWNEKSFDAGIAVCLPILILPVDERFGPSEPHRPLQEVRATPLQHPDEEVYSAAFARTLVTTYLFSSSELIITIHLSIHLYKNYSNVDQFARACSCLPAVKYSNLHGIITHFSRPGVAFQRQGRGTPVPAP